MIFQRLEVILLVKLRSITSEIVRRGVLQYVKRRRQGHTILFVLPITQDVAPFYEMTSPFPARFNLLLLT